MTSGFLGGLVFEFNFWDVLEEVVGSKPNLHAHLLAQPYKVSYSCRLTFVTLSQRSGPYDGLNPRMSIACSYGCV